MKNEVENQKESVKNGTKERKYEEKDYWNPHFLCSKYMLYGGLIHEFTYT